MNSQSAERRIAIVGAGISGLAAAFRLRELRPNWDVIVYESTRSPGGIVQTTQREGCVVERSADMFTTREPWGVSLCQRLGIADRLINTQPHGRKALVVCDGQLLEIPQGFTLMAPARLWPLVMTRLLTWRGKLRLAAEPFVRTVRDRRDESLESFAIRRFGHEAYERLIQPLVGGIYTADPKRLSMAATMPQFLQFERQYGSVIRGMKAEHRASRDSGARYGQFVSLRGGIGELTAAISSRLSPNTLRLNQTVEELAPGVDPGWEVRSRNAEGGRSSERADAVIVCSPAPQAARLVASTNPALAQLLESIEYSGIVIGIACFRCDQLTRPVEAFGIVVPLRERRRILAISVASAKFEGRAPPGQVVLRIFIGGACQPELLQLSDEEVHQLIENETRMLLGATGSPLWVDIVRWNGAMPQYHVGHLDLVQAIDTAAQPMRNFYLAGNAYHGVGLPACIHSGEAAAERAVRALELTLDGPSPDETNFREIAG